MKVDDFILEDAKMEILGNGITGNGVSTIESFDFSQMFSVLPTDIGGNGF